MSVVATPWRLPPRPSPVARSASDAMLGVLVVLAVGLAVVVLQLDLLNDWWFEDDPYVYSAIAQVPSPWLFFHDVAANRLATGSNELAPMLLASMWLDLWIAPRSAAWAYAHTTVAYLGTAIAFYFAMLRLLGGRALALATTVAWMLLPSTTVLAEFLSTRHYLIGLFWALLALIAVDDALQSDGRRRLLALVRVAAFGWLSIISKEFYPPALLTMVFLWFCWKRDWRGAAIPVGLGVCYAFYRFALTEPSFVYYGIPPMSVEQVLKLLLRLPYMTYCSWLGYAALGLTLYLSRQRLREDRALRPVLLIAGATLVVSLLVIFPVGRPVAAAWLTPGTWYRTPCVINTLLLVALAFAVRWLPRPRWQAGVMAAVIATSAAGTQQTAEHWNRMKWQQSAEAGFVLDNPGKTLLSELPAVWYLRGIESFYPEHDSARFYSRWDPQHADAYAATLWGQGPFWVFDGGVVREATPEIRARLSAGLR